MKKRIMYTLTMVFLLFIVGTARAQVEGDRITEGKQLVEKAKLLMAEGQMLKDAKAPDRAWLVDKGHMMIKQGINITEDGEMMYTDEGRSNMQEIGAKLRQSGGKLLKMGREKGEVTQKDKDSLVKEGGIMMDLGKLMFEKGKFMAGE